MSSIAPIFGFDVIRCDKSLESGENRRLSLAQFAIKLIQKEHTLTVPQNLHGSGELRVYKFLQNEATYETVRVKLGAIEHAEFAHNVRKKRRKRTLAERWGVTWRVVSENIFLGNGYSREMKRVL